MMRGDIHDVKLALQQVLQTTSFKEIALAVLAEKQVRIPDLSSPFKVHDPVVYTEEKASLQVFPACEILAYTTTYSEEEMVKQGRHRVGLRWTCVADSEQEVAAHVEILCTAVVEWLWNPLFAGYITSQADLNAGSVTILEEDFSPLSPGEKGGLQKSGVVVLEVTTYRS